MHESASLKFVPMAGPRAAFGCTEEWLAMGACMGPGNEANSAMT